MQRMKNTKKPSWGAILILFGSQRDSFNLIFAIVEEEAMATTTTTTLAASTVTTVIAEARGVFEERD